MSDFPEGTIQIDIKTNKYIIKQGLATELVLISKSGQQLEVVVMFDIVEMFSIV